MGRFDLLPRWFYKVHSKFRTPVRTILVFGVIGIALAMVGELTFVADLSNFGALLSYIVVNVCLIVLRNKGPESYRAWKVPGTVKINLGERKILIPWVSVIGAISCAVLWGLILTFHESGRILGTVWLVVGVAGFIALRRIKHMPVFGTESGKRIKPGGYVINATVFIRTPEIEKGVVSAIRESLDKRFSITLLSIIDPADLGLSMDNLRDYSQIKDYELKSNEELQSIAHGLRSAGYDASSRVEIGHFDAILHEEAESDRNDVLVLIKRRTLRGHIEKKREDSTLAVLSKYPGKVMIVRRGN
jgi:APA family basic amino acid/polyamine antiporter